MRIEKMANVVARKVIAETDYQKYFQKKLDKYKVKSPSELEDADKKKFFDEVDKGWKGKKETD